MVPCTVLHALAAGLSRGRNGEGDDNLSRSKDKISPSSQAHLFPSCRPKWYPALLQSRSHASAAVLAQEEKGKTLVVFKGEQNKWSSLWVEEVVPWTDRRPEEISDKMDLPQEYARIVDWARAEHDWLCRFDEKGGYKVKHHSAFLALFYIEILLGRNPSLASEMRGLLTRPFLVFADRPGILLSKSRNTKPETRTCRVSVPTQGVLVNACRQDASPAAAFWVSVLQ